MDEVELQQAQSQLSKLIDRVECGETLTLTRDGKPVARIVPITQRRPGLLKGQIGMAPDFDATPEWMVEAFEGGPSDETNNGTSVAYSVLGGPATNFSRTK